MPQITIGTCEDCEYEHLETCTNSSPKIEPRYYYNGKLVGCANGWKKKETIEDKIEKFKKTHLFHKHHDMFDQLLTEYKEAILKEKEE